MSEERCGYTLIGRDEERYPCNRPAPFWRWYQNVEHEDSLDRACGLHANEGGRRMHEAESQIRHLRVQLGAVKALATLWEEEAEKHIVDAAALPETMLASIRMDWNATVNREHAAAIRDLLSED